MTIGWQIILRRDDDAVLAPGVDARRALSSAICRVARGSGLVAFSAPDGHAHLPTLDTQRQAGQLARRVLLSLGQVLGHAGHFEPARLRPIHDQGHLRNLFRYTLDQERHHGIEVDPFHEASALPDLLGLRTTGAWMRGVVARHLPRLGRSDLVELLGVEPRDLVEVDIAELAGAAAASIGRAGLGSRRPAEVLARSAAVQLGQEGFSSSVLAKALQITPRSVQRLAQHPVPARFLAAVGGQWRLRTWVRAQPPARSGC